MLPEHETDPTVGTLTSPGAAVSGAMPGGAAADYLTRDQNDLPMASNMSCTGPPEEVDLPVQRRRTTEVLVAVTPSGHIGRLNNEIDCKRTESGAPRRATLTQSVELDEGDVDLELSEESGTDPTHMVNGVDIFKLTRQVQLLLPTDDQYLADGHLFAEGGVVSNTLIKP